MSLEKILLGKRVIVNTTDGATIIGTVAGTTQSGRNQIIILKNTVILRNNRSFVFPVTLINANQINSVAPFVAKK